MSSDYLNRTESLLVESLAALAPIAAAFSGGVDSAVLAKGAVTASEQFGLPMPRAVLAVSPTSSASDIENADAAAREIRIPLTRFKSGEFSDPEFLRNGRDRCCHCKRIRFQEILRIVHGWEEETGRKWTLIDGENADDLSEYRPGHRAAKELGVRSPLAELGIRKETVRELARRWGLSVAERPSTPCLVTRLAYGLQPAGELLRQVESAERVLHSYNFPICRVRVDTPGTARIEVPEKEIPRLFEEETRIGILEGVKTAGFSAVSVDLEGFLSGKMDNLPFHTKG